MRQWTRIRNSPQLSFWGWGMVCAGCVLWGISSVHAQQPQRKTWTDTPDWASTSGHQNVTWTDVSGQIQLVKNPPKSQQTPFIYIPNSEANTIAQLDTKTGKVNWTFNLNGLAGLDRNTGSPSRTTVDANGHVWFGMRFVMSGGQATDYADGVLWVSMQGKLLKIVKGGQTARAITVDLQGNVWVGYWRSNKVIKLDGKTGNILLTVNNVACPYGAVADINNNIWIVNNCKWDDSNTLTKINQSGSVIGKYPAPGAYGIATDLNGQVWSGNWPGGCLHRFTNDGKNLGCIPLNARPRGVAVDGDGNVWVPCSHVGDTETKMVAKVSNTGQILGRFTDVGKHSIGVAVDADGFIWVVSYRENLAAKINAKTGQTVGKYYTGGSGPYTYSDMTGFAFQSLANPAQGYWRGTANTPCLSKWTKISWNGNTPQGTSVTVRARTAATKAALQSAAWGAPLNNGDPINAPDNPWIEVEVAMRTFDAQITPYVTDVTVESVPSGTEICNGIDDDCDGFIDNIPGTQKPITKPCETPCGKGIAPCVSGDWSICSAPYPTPEVCNGVDDDCNGKVDDGATCGGSTLCYNGGCVNKCINECPGGQVCQDGKCVGRQSCSEIKCDAGKVCRNGVCVNPCFGIVCPTDKPYVCVDGKCVQDDCYSKPCPNGQICRNGQCAAHPCTGVTCPEGQACKNGTCVPVCTGVQCPTGQDCVEGQCKADPCAGVSCQAGEVCNFGQCQSDPCKDRNCRQGQICQRGQCIDNPCSGVICPVGQVCKLPNGDCFGSSGGPDPSEYFGSQPEGNTLPTDGSNQLDGGNVIVSDGGTSSQKDEGSRRRSTGDCVCSMRDPRDGAVGASAIFLALLLLFINLRRRPS